ncbi:MAG TPA: helix-turn-helix domain-containing protein [Phascolarctobacterium faecium]|jgi:hypothetical protein plarl_12301|uniref:helix-turn-helix domain-containing protein n=1 Tax=Phascolarctobacterium faecium TaxID=33025 RepID=UPI00206C089B|nr:helix-turn-helix transcriptional regulator [Phascolarctobacterium faecium]DAN19114.1 MAG TPA: repressor protein [Caudoviricetes sp.]HJI10412.1 helix-turn-helix domain-containing protein [Phascolarctobacterium faecium]
MIYECIKNLCKSKKISINQLEKDLGFGSGTIYKWQSVSPSVDNLKKVADFFGCTLDELLKSA